MITRRSLFESAGAAAAAISSLALLRWSSSSAAAQAALKLTAELPEGTRAEAILDALPGKKPLIKLSYRPPNYETPVSDFNAAITPNDKFFVRYHLSDIPQVDAKTWKLKIGGNGANKEISLDLEQLKNLPAFEIVAVCQCSGNRRGLFAPHVAGVEWGYGAMGCARWKGARLKDVLEMVGLKKEAVEIVFDGADKPAWEKTPDFIKSLPIWRALDETTLIAYEMNGEPLPHWNGFPARIVVPGWTATYWVKHLTSITAVTKPFDGFWMKTAYRIPLGKFPLVSRFVSQETAVNTPITEMVVNSLITSHQDGAAVKVNSSATLSGVAWDAGFGIRAVEVSTDGGQTWLEAKLGDNLGLFAFRQWSYPLAFANPGKYVTMVRAINKIGQTQAAQLISNPAGYHHNVIQSMTFIAV